MSVPASEPWLFWSALALLGALAATDETSLGQTWFSQPLPAAILAGVVTGDPAAGLLPGLLAQAMVLGNLPIGASFRLDTASATVGVTAGAVLAGWSGAVSPFSAAAWTGPAAARLGWILVVTAAAGLLGGRLVHLERQARLGWMLDGYRSVRDGDVGRLVQLHRRCLATTAVRGAVLTVIWALATRAIWNLAWRGLPPVAREALGLLPLLVPALAAGTLLERFGHRRSWPLVTAGTLAGLAWALLGT